MSRPTPIRAATANRSLLMFVGLLLVAANLRGAITSVGPVLNDVQATFQLSAFEGSILISIPLVAFGLFSPVAPRIAKAVGIERALGLALLVLAIGILARSMPWLPILWLGTVLLGIGIAVLNVVIPALVKRDYPDRIGPVTGMYSAVQAGVAAAAAGLAVPIAGTNPEGWRLSLGVWAGLAFVTLAVLAPRLRHRTPLAPEWTGPDQPAHRSPWRSALGWQVAIYMGLQSTMFYTLLTWLPSIEQAHGTSPAVAGFHLFIFNGTAIVGNLVIAAFIPRWPSQIRVHLVTSVLILVSLVGLMTAPSWDLLWVAVGGVGVGAAFVLALSMLGLRAVNHRQAASLSGMAQCVGYLIAAAGPISVGLLHDRLNSWSKSLIFLLVVLAGQAAIGWQAARDRTLG